MNDNNLALKTRLADALLRPLFRLPLMERVLLKAHALTGYEWPLKLAPTHYAYPADSHREVIRDAIRYRVDLSTYHGWGIYYHRSRNEPITKLVKKGDTVLDIGTNIGEVALTFARAVWPTGRVVAFEPNPATFEALKGNRERNPGLSITIENVAVGDSPGFVTMVLPDGRNPGTATIDPEPGASRSFSVRVPVITLDAYVKERMTGPIHMVKIDVEGYECHVLDGAVSMLRQHRPLLVVELCDAHQKRHGRSARHLVDQIMALGYEIVRLDDGQPVALDQLDGCNFDAKCTPVSRGVADLFRLTHQPGGSLS